MERKSKKNIYIFYEMEKELPVCYCENIREVQDFLGTKTLNAVSSVLCHYFRGDNEKIHGRSGKFYTCAKFTEEELDRNETESDL